MKQSADLSLLALKLYAKVIKDKQQLNQVKGGVVGIDDLRTGVVGIDDLRTGIVTP